MNNDKVSVLNPTKDVPLREGGKVEVGEMPWPAALKFMQTLSKYAKQFITEKGEVKFSPAQIGDLVCNVGELSEVLILGATGKDKTWLDKVPFSDALEILDAALELNLSEEILAKAKKPLGRFAQLLAVKVTRTPSSPELLIT